MTRLRALAVVMAMTSAVVMFAAIILAANHVALTFAPTLGIASEATPITHYGLEYGSLTDTLVSPDNITIRIVALQRGATVWSFHIHVHNNTHHSVSFVDAATSHYFVLGGKGTANVPYTWDQLTVKLTAPIPSASAYPPLSPTVAAGGAVDGWLVADLSHFKYPPAQLMYVYGTVSSVACATPNDQSTCHPSTGYRTLVWNLM